MPREGSALARNHHIDDAETAPHVGFEQVTGQPSCSCDLHIASGNLAALEAALSVFGSDDVDEGQGVLVVGDQVDGSSLGGPTCFEELEALALDEADGRFDYPLLKFGIAYDGLRLFATSPFGPPCYPEAALAPAEGKGSKRKPKRAHEFCVAKVFHALSAAPGSERAWRSQGKAKEDFPAREALRNEPREGLLVSHHEGNS